MSFLQTTLKKEQAQQQNKQQDKSKNFFHCWCCYTYGTRQGGMFMTFPDPKSVCVCVCFFFLLFLLSCHNISHTTHTPPQAKEKKRVSRRAFIVRQQNVYTTHLSETLRTPAHARTWSSDIRSGEPPPPPSSLFSRNVKIKKKN